MSISVLTNATLKMKGLETKLNKGHHYISSPLSNNAITSSCCRLYTGSDNQTAYPLLKTLC